MMADTSRLQQQISTVPLSHVTGSAEPPVAWLQGAGEAGRSLPLVLARDLGLVLSRPRDTLEIRRPPEPRVVRRGEDCAAYITFLEGVAGHFLVRRLSASHPPLSDAVVSAILARLVEGIDFSDHYRIPGGAAGVVFLRALSARLTEGDPMRTWKELGARQRPRLSELLPSEVLAAVERNLAALDQDEMRYLARYGATFADGPDPRDLARLVRLTDLPPVARLALSQTLQLLPRVSAEVALGGVQTYPEGGYEGLARRGSLDSLLPSEMAFPPGLALHRIANREALYYGRERRRQRRRELAYVVAQSGRGLGGDGQVAAKALLLALARALRGRGYEVLYSLAGSMLEEPRALKSPAEVARLVHHRERGQADAEHVLTGVLRHLRSWRALYRARYLLWVVSEHFDADGSEDHGSLYRSLKSEAPQQAWYVRVGAPEDAPPPATAGLLGGWQIVETADLVTPVYAAAESRREPVAGDLWRDPRLGMEFSYIPPGTFQMGSAADEKPPARWLFMEPADGFHGVRLTRGFWLARTAVTQGQFERFIESSGHEMEDRWRESGEQHQPVTYVSWHDARAFCVWMSEQTGETIRLPTEAEWEYGARAGTSEARYSNTLRDIAWYAENSGGKPHPVGQKTPNSWGLFDMLGNVLEWVEDSTDLRDIRADEEPVVDPLCREGLYRVVRGGSWNNSEDRCRAGHRDGVGGMVPYQLVGFRVVRA